MTHPCWWGCLVSCEQCLSSMPKHNSITSQRWQKHRTHCLLNSTLIHTQHTPAETPQHFSVDILYTHYTPPPAKTPMRKACPSFLASVWLSVRGSLACLPTLKVSIRQLNLFQPLADNAGQSIVKPIIWKLALISRGVFVSGHVACKGDDILPWCTCVAVSCFRSISQQASELRA